MSRMKKRAKIALIMTLIVTLALPFQVYAEKKLDPVLTLKFADVEPLMMSRCQLILDNTKAYNDANTGQGNVQSATNSLDALLVQLSGAGSAGDSAIFKNVLDQLIQAQMKTSIGLNSMAQSTNMTEYGLNTEKGNKTIVWNMETMFITYNDLAGQIDELSYKKSMLEKQLAAAKLQKELGMINEISYQNVEGTLKEVESGLKQLQESRQSIKQTFNVNLAQPYDTDLIISEVPKVTSEQIAAIKVDDEYKEALKKAYGVRIGDAKNDTDKKNDEIRKFQNGFYRAYQSILEKQKALEAEQVKMAAAEKNMKAADLKYKLGMLSSVQYESEKSTYASRKTALAAAENALFKAYRQYEWAKRGLIISN